MFYIAYLKHVNNMGTYVNFVNFMIPISDTNVRYSTSNIVTKRIRITLTDENTNMHHIVSQLQALQLGEMSMYEEQLT